MSKNKHSPTLYQRNLAQHIYQPPPRETPLWLQAVIVIVVIVGFCVIVLALGGGAG